MLGSAPRDRWPDDQMIFVSNVPDPNGLPAAQDFVKNYNAIPIDGTRAGPIALQTYDALNLLFEAFARAEKIDRDGVQAALRQIDFNGLGARYAFDQQGNLIDPQTYVFEYDQRSTTAFDPVGARSHSRRLGCPYAFFSLHCACTTRTTPTFR